MQAFASIVENENGPILFKSSKSQDILVYDLDLGENSTFRLEMSSIQPNNSLAGCPIKTIDNYFQLDQKIESKSNLNLMNSASFDFDTLNIKPSFDLFGVAYKNLNISVIIK